RRVGPQSACRPPSLPEIRYRILPECWASKRPSLDCTPRLVSRGKDPRASAPSAQDVIDGKSREAFYIPVRFLQRESRSREVFHEGARRPGEGPPGVCADKTGRRTKR